MLSIYAALTLLFATASVQSQKAPDIAPANVFRLYPSYDCTGNQDSGALTIRGSRCVDTASAGYNSFKASGNANGCVWGYTSENCENEDDPASAGIPLTDTCAVFPDEDTKSFEDKRQQYKSYWASADPC